MPDEFYERALATHRLRDWTEIVRRQSVAGGVLKAVIDGQIVGLCQYGPSEDDDADPQSVGEIHRLYVDPDRQRMGIGRSLLAEAAVRLHEMGVSKATLWVLESSERARAFYESVGWLCDGKHKLDGDVDIRYWLPLS